MTRALTALTLLVALGACAASPRASSRPVPVEVARGAPVFHGETGAPVSWSELVERCGQAQVVLVGETHGQALGLAAAAALFEDVAARRSESAALSLEFFERDQQTALDDYLGGVTDEDAFFAAALRSASNYPAGHRRMVETARLLGRPVSAANAPRRYASIARTEGFDRLRALSAEQRRLFEIPPSLTSGGYRERFFELMGAPSGASAAHGGAAEEIVLDFYRAQNLWDATMAKSVELLLETGARPIFHVVGRFHTDFQGGLTQRIERARLGVDVVTLSFVDEPASALRDEDRGRADFVFYTGGPG